MTWPKTILPPTVDRGLFLILVGRAVAPFWDVDIPVGGINLTKKMAYVNHYSFHIMDPEWGHITIKMGGHPPFGAPDYPERTRVRRLPGQEAPSQLHQGGQLLHPNHRRYTLARIADTLADIRLTGRLIQVCERWIYSACLCFGLGIREQERTGFHYAYSIYQLEYSRTCSSIGHRLSRSFNE